MVVFFIYSSTYQIILSYPPAFSLQKRCPRSPRGTSTLGKNHPQELLCDACARLEVAESSDDRELPQAQIPRDPPIGILAEPEGGVPNN